MQKTFLVCLLLLLVAMPFIVSASTILTNSLEQAAPSGLTTNAKTPISIQNFVGKIINAFLGLLGTIFLVLIVYGGYLWMAAGGNEEDVSKAKKLIAQAILGLAVIMGAYAISYFVTFKLESATGL